MISLTTIVLSVAAICVVDWYLLLRATIKHDRDLGHANQPNYGRSTYYMIFAQLVSIIVLTLLYMFISGMFFPVSFPLSHEFLVAGIVALTYIIYKIVVAFVQTVLNFMIIEIVSARYERESKKELKESDK